MALPEDVIVDKKFLMNAIMDSAFEDWTEVKTVVRAEIIVLSSVLTSILELRISLLKEANKAFSLGPDFMELDWRYLLKESTTKRSRLSKTGVVQTAS